MRFEVILLESSRQQILPLPLPVFLLGNPQSLEIVSGMECQFVLADREEPRCPNR